MNNWVRTGSRADLQAAQELVYFDNNAYRDLVTRHTPANVDAAVTRLKQAEQSNGIQGIMNSVVAMELVARLPSEGSPHPARTALTAMALHVALPNGDLAIGEDPQHAIARQFFQAPLTRNHDVAETLSVAVAWLGQNRTTSLPPNLLQFAQTIEQHVAATESGFLNDMWDHVVKPHYPSLTTAWDGVSARLDLATLINPFLRSASARDIIAAWQLAAVAAEVGYPMPYQPHAKELKAFVAIFGIGIDLYIDILQRVLVNGANMTKKKRENWFWDFHIALGVGMSHAVAGRSISLVTSDSAIIDAARTAGAGAIVSSWADYKLRLRL